MASLAGNAINASCAGLIKTTDNGVVGATEKQITDGLGNAIPMTMGTTGVSFTGGADFTGATVTGLPTGSAGLESGTGADSMQSAASLTTVAADAAGICSIALGNNARACGPQGISIGNNSQQLTNDGVAIGPNTCSASNGTAIGPNTKTTGNQGLAIGHTACAVGNGTAVGRRTCACAQESFAAASSASATGSCSIAIGFTACSATISTIAIGANTSASQDCDIAIGNGAIIDGSVDACPGFNSNIAIGNGACVLLRGLVGSQHAGNIAIGCSAFATNDYDGGAVAIGRSACADAMHTVALGSAFACQDFSIAIGQNSKACNINSIGIGRCSCISGDYGIALGSNTCTSANSAVAIGYQVTAAKVDTVTVKELETCVAGGGITLKSADLTEEKMTLTDADVLAVGGDTIPANDSATPTVVNRIWSGSQAQYDALGSYDANTLYYIA